MRIVEWEYHKKSKEELYQLKGFILKLLKNAYINFSRTFSN